MLIYYLTGYPPQSDSGGGGFGNRSLINAGIKLGHTINIYDSEGSVPSIPPDLFWLCDMNGRFSLEFIRRITRNYSIRFIIQDDGYQNLCPQPTREYKLCFQDLDPNTKWDIPLDIFRDEQMYDCSNICRYRLMSELATICAASHSVSPMHAAIWANIFPQLVGKQIIEEPQIDVDLFKPIYPPGIYDRVKGTYLYVGTIAKGKGYLNCMEYVDRQGGTLLTAGDIHHTIRRNQVRNWRGHVPHDRLPRLYSTCEYLIHLPEWQEPQSMVFTEALLCGCKVIVNDKVGATSYPWWGDHTKVFSYYIADITSSGYDEKFHMYHFTRDDPGLRNRIRNAPYKFWEDLSEYRIN